MSWPLEMHRKPHGLLMGAGQKYKRTQQAHAALVGLHFSLAPGLQAGLRPRVARTRGRPPTAPLRGRHRLLSLRTWASLQPSCPVLMAPGQGWKPLLGVRMPGTFGPDLSTWEEEAAGSASALSSL